MDKDIPLEKRKQDEIDFHNKLREVDGDEGVMATHWSPELESTIKNNLMWRNMKYYATKMSFVKTERRREKLVFNAFGRLCPGQTIRFSWPWI